MNETVTRIVNLLFEDLEPTEEVLALRDEVMDNCQERYADRRAHGADEDAAIQAVMDSLAGMEEALKDYPRRAPDPFAKAEAPAGGEQAGTAADGDIEFRGRITELSANLTSSDLRVAPSEDGVARVRQRGGEDVQIRAELRGGRLCLSEERGMQKKRASFERLPESLSGLGAFLGNLVESVVSGLEGTTVTVYLPAEQLRRAEIRSTSGDVAWKGPAVLEADISVGSGDISCTLERPAQKLTFQTGSGDVQLNGEAETLRMKTISGDIDWQGAAGSAEVSTVSGDAELTAAVRRLKVTTVSGDLTVRLEDGGVTEQVHVRTTSGDADIFLPADVREADVHGSSVSGGLHMNGVPSRSGARPEISYQTVSGDITVSC